jgi:hypothetical protein
VCPDVFQILHKNEIFALDCGARNCYMRQQHDLGQQRILTIVMALPPRQILFEIILTKPFLTVCIKPVLVPLARIGELTNIVMADTTKLGEIF